ncbi:nitroreductase [Magnetovibrio sp. PR-2]|uniref:nitroreductase family protein n=1 Tax=Magnetovibrio sp. PR-2 TaxID=3120356 RepID=UPI002FCE125A
MSTLENSHLETFLRTMLSRRSVMPKRLGEPGPTIEEVQALVDCALTAPDHNQLKPWRLLMIPRTRRADLAEAFIAGKVRRNGNISDEEKERERDKAASTPVMMALISQVVSNDPYVPVEEQYIAIGAALQNILLGAHAMEYGGIILSGNRVRDIEVREILEMDAGEELIGFICLGSINKQPKSVVRSRYTDVLNSL